MSQSKELEKPNQTSPQRWRPLTLFTRVRELAKLSFQLYFSIPAMDFSYHSMYTGKLSPNCLLLPLLCFQQFLVQCHTQQNRAHLFNSFNSWIKHTLIKCAFHINSQDLSFSPGSGREQSRPKVSRQELNVGSWRRRTRRGCQQPEDWPLGGMPRQLPFTCHILSVCL